MIYKFKEVKQKVGHQSGLVDEGTTGRTFKQKHTFCCESTCNRHDLRCDMMCFQHSTAAIIDIHTLWLCGLKERRGI